MIPVPIGTHTHVAGDSITAGGWDVVHGGLKDQMSYARKIASAGVGAQRGRLQANATTAKLQAGATAAIVVSPTSLITHTSFGIPGSKVADLVSNYSTFITPYLPFDILIIEVGVNDYAITDPATFLASYLTLLDMVHSDAPTAKVICLGILTPRTEQWSGQAFANGFSLADPIEANIHAAATARATYATYAAQADWTLAYEQVNNTPSLGAASGILTLDGTHPNPGAEVLMGTHLMSQFTF